MKKTLKWAFIATIFAFAVICFGIAMAEIASGTDGDITWSLSDAGVLTIGGNGPMNDYDVLIGSPWYGYSDEVNSVIIGENVTSIGDAAFMGCSKLTGITIPNSVTIIGKNAFYSCSKLTGITIPNSVNNIGNHAFYKCSKLTSITIPNSVNRIGSYAFNACSELTIALILNSGTTINNTAFNKCPNLTIFGQSGSAAENYANEKGISFISLRNIYGQCGESVNWLFFEDTNTLIIFGSGDMWDYEDTNPPWSIHNIGSVSIEDGVTRIGNNAFLDCSELSSVTIPNSVTSIGDSAFYNCSSLTNIEIPNSVTSIGNSAFRNCGLTNITIPNSVTSINNSAFRDCSSLAGIEIQYSVTRIGDSAFYNCSSLADIEIPYSVTRIGDSAFYNCSSLVDIEIPNSVTSIGISAFEDCSKLKIVVIPKNVTSIDNKTFFNCSSLTGVEIPNSVESIGDYAFYGCSSLTDISIPKGVNNIGKYSYYNCSSLTSVTIPTSVTSIGEGAFKGCSSLSVILYRGTEQNWNNINKGTDWKTGTHDALEIIVGVIDVSLTFAGSGNGSVIVTAGKVQYTLYSKDGTKTLYLPPGVVHIEPVPDQFNRFNGAQVGINRSDGTTLFINLEEDSFQVEEDVIYSLKLTFTSTISGSGTSLKPWLIGSRSDWSRVATAVAYGQVPEGKHFRLTQSIIVSSMIGTADHPFTGTFDGGGNTLTVALEDTGAYLAPFRYVSGAAIEHLRVEGTVTASAASASGLVGSALGNCAITDCVVDVDISASDGGGHSGFAAMCNGGTVSVKGSAFTGTIDAQDADFCAGFLGWQGDTAEDCVYDGQMNAASYSNDFIRTNDYAKNCYSMNLVDIDRIKGRQAIAVTPDEGVTIGFGETKTTYPTSGITTYAIDDTADPVGLMYGGVFFAGPGQTVTLNLTALAPEGMLVSGFTASTGTLTRNGGTWTLTLADSEAIISAAYAPAFGTPDFILPAGLTEVEEGAFEGIAASVVEVPEDCVSICAGAFRNCPNLTQIRIPADCVLGEDVFDDCEFVYVYGVENSSAEAYCSDPEHGNCVFVEE